MTSWFDLWSNKASEEEGLCLQNVSDPNDITINVWVVIFIGSLVGILMLKTLDLLIRLHLFGDYYAWSAANDVKRVQTGYIKNFRYLMTTGCGNTIVSRWRCHSRGRKHRDQAIKWIRSNSEIAIPPKRVQSPQKITKSRRCRYLTLYPVKKKLCIAGF